MAYTSTDTEEDAVGFVGDGIIGTLTFTIASKIESCETPLDVHIFKATAVNNSDRTDLVGVSGKVTIKGVTPVLNTLTLDKTTVQVDGTTGDTITATSVLSKGNTELKDSVDLTVAPSDQGVTIESGAVKVGPKAKDGTYTVTATPKDGATATGSATAQFTVTRTAAVPTQVKISRGGKVLGEKDTVVMPIKGGSDKTYAYTADVYSQYDEVIADDTATLTATSGTNTAITFANNTLTVTADATKDSKVTLTATSSKDSNKTTSVEVTITDVNVDWSRVTAALKTGGITYGETNSAAFTNLPETGTADAGGTPLVGTFSVKEGNKFPAAGENQKVTVEFLITSEGEYKNVPVTQDYEVKVAKKPIEVTVDSTSETNKINYGDELPASYEIKVDGDPFVDNDTLETVLGGINGLGTHLEAVKAEGNTKTALAGRDSDAGSYEVRMKESDPFTHANYTVTIKANTDGLEIRKAKITGFADPPAAEAADAYANDPKNATTANTSNLAGLKELAEVKDVAILTGQYSVKANGSNVTPEAKTVELPVTWTADKAHNVKGATYKFTATVDYGKNFELDANAKAPEVTLVVNPVKGTVAFEQKDGKENNTVTKSTGTVAKSTWDDIGLPKNVVVTYKQDDGSAYPSDKVASPKTIAISGWDKTPAAAAANGPTDPTAEDVHVALKPTVTGGYPEWATISNAATLAFDLVLSARTPVTVTLGDVANTTYGTYVTVPKPTQTDKDGGGTDAADKYKYYYEGVAPTVYTKSETKPTDVGTYKVTAELDSTTHTGSDSKQFSITAKALDASMFTLNPATFVYNTNVQKPTVSGKDKGVYAEATVETDLVLDKDFTVTCGENKNVNTYTVTITGKGNYSGTVTKSYEITKAHITEDMTPDISGIAEAGYVLTAILDGVDTSELVWTWTVGDDTHEGPTYEVKPEDSNKVITVQAEAAEAGNYEGTSAVSDEVQVAKVTVTGTVTISKSGDQDAAIVAGDILTANVSMNPTDAATGATYQWYKNGEAIADPAGTGTTYTVDAGDTDASITVEVTPNADFDTENPLTSAAVVVGRKVLSGTVTVAVDGVGDADVSSVLKATVTSDVDPANYDIVWLRDGTPISGENGETYTVTADDLGKTISAKIAAKGDDYSGEIVATGVKVKAKAPGAPVVTVNAGNTQVTVNWTTPAANGAPITQYTVTCTADGEETKTVTLPVGTNTHPFSGLTNGKTYTFVVTAYNSKGGTDSESKTATPNAPVVTPDPTPDPVTPEDPYDPYYPPYYGPGGGGGGATPKPTPGPTPNPDVVTTTTTDKEGNTTTTTTYPDGSKNIVEVRADGTTVLTDIDSQGNSTSTASNPDGSTETTVKNVDGSSSVVSTDAAGKTTASVTLPADMVNAASASNTPASLPMQSVAATDSVATAPTVTVKTENNQPVKVEIPVSNSSTGTVAVLVKPDGSTEIIKASIPTPNGVAVKLNSGEQVKIIDNSQSFTDVGSSYWGKDAVNFVASRELFQGTGEGAFSPDASMTRGMLMTVLARFENVDTTGGSVWYEKGVAWAVAQGLSDGTNPNGQITREQLAAILYRYAQSKGLDISARGSLERFPDAGQVSDWAREAMSWAVGTGIISGVGGVTLEPNGNATRAQVATMLMRYVEKFV